MASSIAFFWAVDPSPSSDPESAAAEDDPEAAAPLVELLPLELLLSEPQAATRAREPARAKPPRRAVRESFTEVSSFALVPSSGRRLREAPAGRARSRPAPTLRGSGEATARAI